MEDVIYQIQIIEDMDNSDYHNEFFDRFKTWEQKRTERYQC